MTCGPARWRASSLTFRPRWKGWCHNECLIEALQRRCGFEPVEVRVVILDAQPIHRQRQEYRLVDAATGEFERGYCDVADMATNQPRNDDIPVYVQSGRVSGP